MGREATIFEIEDISYDNIINAIRTGDGLKATIETPPAYGKYHWDGHRDCGFSCSPKESRKLKGKCPKCGKELTIGVDYRVEEIAVEKKGFKAKNAKPYYSVLPLHELLSLHIGSGMNSKTVWKKYNEMIELFQNEFNIILKVSKDELLNKEVDLKLVELIILNRQGKLKVKPGYDGVYGEVLVPEKQSKLF